MRNRFLSFKEWLTQNWKTSLAVFLFLVSPFVPLLSLAGVALMWFWTGWSTKTKILLSIPLVFLFFFSAFSFFMVNYLFFIRPFEVKGISMFPSIKEGQFLLTRALFPGQDNIKRGEVVIFVPPGELDRYFIQRVIGLPGEKVMIKGGRVFINGQPLDENRYLKNDVPTLASDFIGEGEPRQIPYNQYFTLGDNRQTSLDSRKFGFVPKNNIVSKYWFCYWNCR